MVDAPSPRENITHGHFKVDISHLSYFCDLNKVQNVHMREDNELCIGECIIFKEKVFLTIT